MNNLLRTSAMISALTLVAIIPNVVQANTIFTHQGQNDPTTEGFGIAVVGSPSTVGPITNDMGLAAWSIAAEQNSQFHYASGTLSKVQMADIASHGFNLTLTARALQGTAPTYDTATPYAFTYANFDTGSRRFDIMLGVNAQGETVVTLPTSYIATASTAQVFGPNFTLTSSSDYHTYQLAFDPQTQLADLFVDNINVIQNYAGNTMFLSNWGLGWGAIGGGQGNFNFVQLAAPVPIPAAIWLFGSALGALGFFNKRRLA